MDEFIRFNRDSSPTFAGPPSYSVSWEPKAEWQGREDKGCSGADAFKKSIVYACNATGNLNYLNEIAQKKKHTLAQELGEAFQYQGKNAATAMSEGAADGYYNGGNFSVTEEFYKNRYCYEEPLAYFFSIARNYDYNWVKFNHNVNYIDGDGNPRTNVETRRFALTKTRYFSGPSVPGTSNLHKEEGFDGKGVNLFLVSPYEV